jgi:hypothetical protein
MLGLDWCLLRFHVPNIELILPERQTKTLRRERSQWKTHLLEPLTFAQVNQAMVEPLSNMVSSQGSIGRHFIAPKDKRLSSVSRSNVLSQTLHLPVQEGFDGLTEDVAAHTSTP